MGRPVDFRNYCTHGVLTQQEIDSAISIFATRKLWDSGVMDGNIQPGRAFIDGHHTRSVLMDLLGDGTDPTSYYTNLIAELSAILRNLHAD